MERLVHIYGRPLILRYFGRFDNGTPIVEIEGVFYTLTPYPVHDNYALSVADHAVERVWGNSFPLVEKV